MEKIIIIGLVSIVTILIINLYEAYRVIQILLNKVSELNRESFVLKNKEKIKKLKKAIKDSSISIEDFIEELEDGYTYIVAGNEIYLKLKNTEIEEGNR